MSFCRITGKSRGLPKPNYFPILPPISPADAKRLCRITTKSQGLPSHHYIPALSSALNSRVFCKVTAKAEGQGQHHFPNVDEILKPHVLMPDYRYVFPKFDEEQKHQKALITLLNTKVGLENINARYVYSVDEKKTNLVIPAGLEAAVRDGEVRDVMLDSGGETILIKMYQGPNVTVNVEDFVPSDDLLMWEGMGPSEAVLLQREKEEKLNKKRKSGQLLGLKSRTKIFEDREKAFDLEQLELANREEMKKAKLLKMKMADQEIPKKNQYIDFANLREKLLSESDDSEPIFGHIVHMSGSVTFFPGTSVIDLPEGKIIPGRMERFEDNVKFVPGIMLEGKFVPGQMVVTNSGEEFVPGQVIQTREGAKFVPGQFVETGSGCKFVPGQTIETEHGPQFVPGQIIETKAGPTFVPGQIIVTGNQAKFVPGRIIETSDGPHFVPGRVIEAGEQVIFVSGEVVETPEGLKFVAPDLEEAVDGAQEFSVQGFEVTPEELKLFHTTGCHAASDTNVAIDSEVLKQLLKAGMSVGRQISMEIPKVDVSLLPVTSDKLRLSGELTVKMTQAMLSLAHAALKVFKQDESCTTNVDLSEVEVQHIQDLEQNKNLEKYLRVIVASAVAKCRKEKSWSEEAFMNAVSSSIGFTLGKMVEEVSVNKVVETIHNFLKVPANFNQIINEAEHYLVTHETLQDRLTFVINTSSEPLKVIKKLSKSLHGTIKEGFRELFSKNTKLLEEVVKRLNNLPDCPEEIEMEETLQSAIIAVVKEQSKQKLEEILSNSESKTDVEIKEFKNLLLQAVGLAKALGMIGVASTLLQVVSDSKSHEVLSGDLTIMNILQKLTIMRQIAENKPEFTEALAKLTTNPESAQKDPSVRELLTKSTALFVKPQKDLESSSDIPISLLLSCNPLAMEDYLATKKRPKILLILKAGIQAVIPREAAKEVLSGKVPYAVVDEKGIKYFEPRRRAGSTIKLPARYNSSCYSFYGCPERSTSFDSFGSRTRFKR